MKIVVYTAIYGQDRKLHPPFINNVMVNGNHIQYICFTDWNLESTSYDLQDYCWRDVNATRTSRWGKINSHLVFPDADITIWHDASYQVKNISALLNSLEEPWEFCTFKHYRTTIEQEISACINLRKEQPEILNEQLEYYRSLGMPQTDRLYDNSFIVRKNTPKVRQINELWWSEYCNHSCRDQISLPFVFWRLQYDAWKEIPGSRYQNNFLILRDR